MNRFGLLTTHSPSTIKAHWAVLLLALIPSARALFAQGRVFWQEGGVVVCDSTRAAVGEAVAPDGTGGMFAVWADTRGNHESVWAQHVDRDGNMVWQENGVFLRGSTWSPQQFSAVPDGAGGLIAVWIDGFAGPYVRQVTAQRVDSLGRVLWGASGVVVVGTNLGRSFEVSAVSDGRCGVLVGWVMTPTETTDVVDSLCVQRLDSLGRPCWGSPGLIVTVDTLHVRPPRMRPDGYGGAYIAWADNETSRYGTLAQRVDSAGQPVWPVGGVRLFSSRCTPIELTLTRGKVFVLSGIAGRIQAQLLDPAGRILWGPSGMLVRSSTGHIGGAHGCDGGPIGTYVAWPEKRAEVYEVYAQLLDTGGNRMWDTLGVRVGSTFSNEGQEITAVGAGRAGFIVSWPEHSAVTGSWDIYAQRVDSAGRLCWGTAGLGVAVDSGWQSYPSTATDARGGAIVMWGRSYAGESLGLCVQRIGDAVANGDARPVTHLIGPARIRPNPATDFVLIDMQGGAPSLEVLDVAGRVTLTLGRTARSGLVSRFAWDLRGVRGRRVPAGVYYCREPKSKCLLGVVTVCR